MRSIIPGITVSSYVHDIVVLEDDRLLQDMAIPLVAKGYPSIVFQSTRNKNRDAVEQLVLYGQNVQPFHIITQCCLSLRRLVQNNLYAEQFQ